ncbi:molybdopterin-binding protein [Methylobacterium gossipiicola]|nr:molybdopterin-binding protein [Methylobacterium gossipiicola]
MIDAMRHASTALMPLAEAVARLVAGIVPVAEEGRSVHAALGFTAARDLIAERDWPEATSALRDGWAVAADAVTGASAYAPVLLSTPPVWVEAGGRLPEGACTVLPPEALEGRAFVADAPPGDGARRGGEDVKAGTCLVAAGARITPLHRLTLAAAGRDTLPVRVPRIALVATGAASPVVAMLSDLIARDGMVPGETVAAPDESVALSAALTDSRADATFVLGGTGPGRTDHSVAALARAGTVLAHGIALRPGETAAFGRVGDRAVLLLPGRPEAALAAYLALGRPLGAALTGARPPEPETAPLLRKVTGTIGMSDVVFVRRRAGGVDPLGGVDLALSRLAEAEAAILVGPEHEGYPEGAPCAILPL